MSSPLESNNLEGAAMKDESRKVNGWLSFVVGFLALVTTALLTMGLALVFGPLFVR